MDPLMRALTRKYGTDNRSEEIAVAWSIMFGLSILLGNKFVDVQHALVEARESLWDEAAMPQVVALTR
ncbi:hypothetical protein [Streptomyces sp. NPDC005181]|uniref:hypothetical protein n=1 Tax=Streptomyces sp. NPDC005181 TaxID=3156869 RepID=UPI0033A51932